jgi:hypothetical protein
MTALLKKHSTKSSAEYTGFRDRITPRAAPTSTLAKIKKRIVGNIGGPIRRNDGFVTLADAEQLILAHDVLAALLHVVLVYPRLDNGVHGTRLFAKSAVDAFEQIDVIARRAARAVARHIRFDRDRKRRAHRLAQLACDATLFTVRITPQRMQAAEAAALRCLLFGIVQRDLGGKHAFQRDHKTLQQLPEQECFDKAANALH